MRAASLTIARHDPRSASSGLHPSTSASVCPASRSGPKEGVGLSSVHQAQAAWSPYSFRRDGNALSLDRGRPRTHLPAARRIADATVWRSRGFNVASWRNDEIVYSLITDLDEPDVLALVQSAEMR